MPTSLVPTTFSQALGGIKCYAIMTVASTQGFFLARWNNLTSPTHPHTSVHCSGGTLNLPELILGIVWGAMSEVESPVALVGLIAVVPNSATA